MLCSITSLLKFRIHLRTCLYRERLLDAACNIRLTQRRGRSETTVLTVMLLFDYITHMHAKPS